MGKRTIILFSIIIIGSQLLSGCAMAKKNDKRFSEFSNRDMRSLDISRQAMIDIVNYMRNTPELYNTSGSKKRMSLNREQRLSVWHTWQSFLDHILVMDTLGKTYSDYYKKTKGKDKKKAFRISFAAFLAQYRYAMDFITITEQNPDFHVVLNEEVPELGLPEGTYARLKYRFLNVIRGAEFARLNMVYKYYGGDAKLSITKGMGDDIAAIWEEGKGRGPKQTAKNGIRILQDSAFTAWFPVQKGISIGMSKVRVRRGDEYLISQKQIKEIIPELEPGDILLQRREWCLTNIGLPGFWTHAALYIGTPEQRKTFFDDPEVKEWITSQDGKHESVEDLLMSAYPDTYKESIKPQDKNQLTRVIEAKGEGVIFTTLEYSAYADSMVALRPKLSKKTKALAVYRAFHYYGRPYDFNFDFLTDSALVCSEVVYKSYLPAGNDEGLHLSLDEMMGRKVLSPNNIARLYDTEYGKKPQMDMVLFLDGNERKNSASRASVEAFRSSWKRPKWHIVIKDTMLDQEKGVGKK